MAKTNKFNSFYPITDHKHDLGFYLGPIGIDREDSRNDDTARYGIGITYVYFLHGVNTKGWNIGITPAIGKEDGDTKGSLLINAGYQF